MEKISIISLIYQSVEYAEFIYNNLKKHTPELGTGEAEFYFVANDATDEVLRFLKERNYPHFINNNPHYTDEERFKQGYAYPEYCGRVYRGYNYGIKMARNPIVVWINSDNCFSPNWLANLKKRLTPESIVSPRMIQSDTIFPNPINQSKCEVYNFGTGLRQFDEERFLTKVKEISYDTVSIGNAFFPAMIHKSTVEVIGYFPEGNLHNGSYDQISNTGDTDFYLRLAQKGITHITSNDSIVYHFNEGEKYLKIG
jgi:GT2 family glycosyltransferase